jgi:hypothetical protein
MSLREGIGMDYAGKRRRSWWSIGVLASGLMVAMASMIPASPRLHFLPQQDYRRVPVVVVAFDEFPAASLMNRTGGIDRRAYPNFAALAGDSTWFRNTTTVGTFTKEALPALLTGILPPSRSLNDPSFYPHNLFTLLGDAYDIHAIGTLPRLCPRVCVAGHPVDGLLPPSYSVFEAGGRGQTFTSFMEMLEAGPDPALYFAHLILPHSPWRFLPSAQRYTEEEPIPGEIDPPGRGHGWAKDRWPVQQALQRHLLQTGFTDRLLGFLVDRLKSAGLYENSLLVVTADHGVAFEPGRPIRLLRPETAGQLAYVPLFVKLPGDTGGIVSDKPLQTIDIVPTIADGLELSRTWPDIDGVSALGDDDGSQVRHIRAVYFSPDARELRQAVEEKYRAFHRASGSIDPFELAPCGLESIVGESVDAMPTYASPATIAVDASSALANAGPQDKVFPALVSGSVAGGRGRPLVAVAVNGRVASVTRAQAIGDERFEWHAMVRPGSFTTPPNDVAAYAISGCRTPRLGLSGVAYTDVGKIPTPRTIR